MLEYPNIKTDIKIVRKEEPIPARVLRDKMFVRMQSTVCKENKSGQDVLFDVIETAEFYMDEPNFYKSLLEFSIRFAFHHAQNDLYHVVPDYVDPAGSTDHFSGIPMYRVRAKINKPSHE